MSDLTKTNAQFERVMAECKDIFEKKLHDYSASWRLLRPTSVTDQMYIKARRIRTLEINGVSKVGEGIRPEFLGLINYGIIALIQLESGFAEEADMPQSEAIALYSCHATAATELMQKKNFDYGEAWRGMRVSSYTDFILTKIERIKELEDINEQTLASEGIASNIMDIINYAVFGAIRLGEDEQNEAK